MIITNDKIITLHYIMRNGRGEQLEAATKTFLSGSSAISETLQSQLAGLKPGDKKTITLPKGAEDADDDFTFDVHILSTRNATPNELRLGRYLPPLKIHLLSGFLGSGKTTAIEQACRLLKDQSVAVITNDQGISLVDGHRFSHLGVPSSEITGGCFCCNYTQLDENIHALIATHHPQLLFAESVGSCTDLIATVLKPLLDQHPEWQPTISIFADANAIDDRSFAPSVRYIYDKQLEEAQVLVITRSESFPPQWKQEIQARYPGKNILFHNSYNASDLQRWLDTLETLPARPALDSLDIDYDTYADGEARLAWLDQELSIDSQQAAQHLTATIEKKLNQENYPVRRLKFWLTPSKLLINARVQTDPQTLTALVENAIAETNTHHHTQIHTLTQKAFQPGYPTPIHRIA